MLLYFTYFRQLKPKPIGAAHANYLFVLDRNNKRAHLVSIFPDFIIFYCTMERFEQQLSTHVTRGILLVPPGNFDILLIPSKSKKDVFWLFRRKTINRVIEIRDHGSQCCQRPLCTIAGYKSNFLLNSGGLCELEPKSFHKWTSYLSWCIFISFFYLIIWFILFSPPRKFPVWGI